MFTLKSTNPKHNHYMTKHDSVFSFVLVPHQPFYTVSVIIISNTDTHLSVL